jgi:hypothetical protein
MVFNNNIPTISWWSVLLVEDTGETQTDKHYHIMLYQVHLACAGFELTMLVVIGTDCIGSYKSKLPYNHDHNGPIADLFIYTYDAVFIQVSQEK